MSESRCPECGMTHRAGRRVRCRVCDKLVCRFDITTTDKDSGGPSCSDCDKDYLLRRSPEEGR